MTETFSPTTERNTNAPHIKNAPEALQLERLDQVVGSGESIDQAYLDEHKNASRRDLDINRHHAITQLLLKNGISYGETEQEKADYKLAYDTCKYALEHDQNTWLYLSEQDNTLRPRDVAFQNLSAHYADRPAQEVDGASEPHQAESTDMPEAAVSSTDGETSGETTDHADTETTATPIKGERTKLKHGSNLNEAEFEKADEHLTEMMEEYAALIAERSRSIVEGAKTGAGIEHAGNELSELLAGMASELYADMTARGESEEEIVAFIDEFIKNSTEETLAKVEQHRMEEYNKSRPYMKKVYDKWADWSDDKRLKGGRGKKMAVMAAGGAVVGFALAPLVGAVGAGVVTGAVAVAGTRSIGRQLAGGFMKKRDKRFAQAQTEEMNQDLDAIYVGNDEQAQARRLTEAAQEFGRTEQETSDARGENPYVAERNIDLIEFVNQRSHEYRVRNRNRVLAGTAIAMTVGLLSSTAANALTDADWSFGKLRDIDLKNPFEGTDVTGIKDADKDGIIDSEDHDSNNDGISDFDDRDNDGIRNGQDLSPDGVVEPELDRDGDGIRNWMDADPDDASVGKEADNGIELSDAARTVTPGEGGFQTLKEMGVPEHKWEAVWEDAGTKLSDAGKTYRMDDGRWGWSRPMRLSDNDLRILQVAAERQGVSL